MKIGAHVSAAGGLPKAIDRALEIGAEAIQVFASSPRSWRFKPLDDAQAESFRARAKEAGIDCVFQHGIYLVNLGGAPELVEKSVASLIEHMQVASQIGSQGVIFHSGSHKGAGFDAVFDQTVRALSEVLEKSSEGPCLIIENCAGMGDQIGASFAQIGRMIKAVGSSYLRVCIDTEHAFAAGYDLVSPEGLDRAMAEFDHEIGLERLAAVHANDAKVEFASGVDRHENIGEGYIGTEGFRNIMAHPAYRNVPFLLEVPGFEQKGPDKENVDRLKAIRQVLEIPV